MNPSSHRPIRLQLNPGSGDLGPGASPSVRRLSGLAGLFGDGAAERAAIAAGDPVVYGGMSAAVPAEEGEVGVATTRIEAGDVGGEFYMTHGHAHALHQGETYTCLSGRGGLLLRRDRTVVWIELQPHQVGCIPPGWWHRTINVGSDPFVFVAHYPRLSGQDYAPVREHGMGARVVRRGSSHAVVTEPGMHLEEIG